MIRQASLLAAAFALACAGSLAAQEIPSGPRLMRVVASSSGIVLSIDSTSVARMGDSTFVLQTVYDIPADTVRRVAARQQVDGEAIDCGRMRVRPHETSSTRGSPGAAASPVEWRAPADDERPLMELLCQSLLRSFGSLPITRELPTVDEPPQLANVPRVREALIRECPPAARRPGGEGTVMVRVQITAEGEMDMSTARALWATRPDYVPAALRVVQVMRFRPAKAHSSPVAVWVTLPVTFQTSF